MNSINNVYNYLFKSNTVSELANDTQAEPKDYLTHMPQDILNLIIHHLGLNFESIQALHLAEKKITSLTAEALQLSNLHYLEHKFKNFWDKYPKFTRNDFNEIKNPADKVHLLRENIGLLIKDNIPGDSDLLYVFKDVEQDKILLTHLMKSINNFSVFLFENSCVNRHYLHLIKTNQVGLDYVDFHVVEENLCKKFVDTFRYTKSIERIKFDANDWDLLQLEKIFDAINKNETIKEFVFNDKLSWITEYEYQGNIEKILARIRRNKFMRVLESKLQDSFEIISYKNVINCTRKNVT